MLEPYRAGRRRRARRAPLCAAAVALFVAFVFAAAPSAEATCAFPPANDADCDGLGATDPCPADTLNRCLASIAPCATAPPGTQHCTAGQPLRLNFGNVGNKTDCNGDVWLDDLGPGRNGSATVDAAPIQAAFGCTSADTAAIVGSENAAGVLTREYPVAVGSYLVNLLFAETNAPTCVVGSRTADISFEGVRVYGGAAAGDGFDQYAASLAQNAGGNAAHADACGGLVVRSALVDVADGTLDLALTEDNTGVGDNNAAVKAIEVRVVSLPCPAGQDDDGDGVCDAADNCPLAFNPAQQDTGDGNDGVGDACDNCAAAANPTQSDADFDAKGDACDVCPGDGLDDFDGDGVCAGAGFSAPKTDDADNCAAEANAAQTNADGDGRGDACDICTTSTGAAEDTCLGAGAWVARAPNPLERSEAGLVTVDGLVYLIGGEQSGTGTSVQVYDPAQDTWIAGPSLPAARDHVQPVVVGRKIYVIGGLLAFPGPSTDTVFVLDTLNPAAGWQTKKPMPTSRGAQGCAADGVRIFCAGGLSSTASDMAVDVFEVYNTVTDQWAPLPDMPRVRDHFWAQIVGGKFYAIGGRDTLRSATYTHNDVYDIATGAWSQGAPLPTARGGYGSAVIEGRIVVAGGEGGGPVAGTFPNVDEYDPVRNTWRALAPLTTSRHSLGLAVSDARDGIHPRLYAISGGVSEGGSKSAVNEELAYRECTTAGAPCEDGDACTVNFCSAQRCESTPAACCEERVWIEAATDATASFAGAMTTGAAYTGGQDLDPVLDSLNASLVFANSTTNGSAGNADKVTYQILLPADGNWYAWGRFYYPGAPGSNDANSFFLRVDAGTALRFGNNRDFFRRWHWDGEGVVETGAPAPLALGFLAAGAHVLTIEKREVVPIPPRLDALFLTRNPLEVPTDAGAADARECCTIDADCNDANACTDEICDGSACVRSNNSAACSDGLFCNGADACGAGSCSVHAGSPCGAGGECAAGCNETTDTCTTAAGLPCTDDGNPCTTDTCDASGACVHAANAAPCNDGVFCNGADTCAAGACSLHGGNPCTGGSQCADTCNEAADSCLDAAGTPCNDGQACTTTDQCNGAGACAGQAVDCSASADECNTAGCSTTTGACVKTPRPNGTACDDGRFCSVSDACTAGVCDGTPRTCTDGVACTVDACDETADTCTALPNDDACDDGGFCNGAETCTPAGCVSAGAPDCTHLDSECGAGVCDETAAGCIVEAANEGTACDDADPCTDTDACTEGTCAGAPVSNIVDGRIRVRMDAVGDADRFSLRALAEVDVVAAPTVVGAELSLRGTTGELAYAAEVPASAFRDASGGKGRTFVFKDDTGMLAGGLTLLRLDARPRTGAWRVRAKLGAGDLSALAGTETLTLELAVGEDTDAACLGIAAADCSSSAPAFSCQFP